MHRYVVIDAFASEPLQGNPVAVFFDCDDLSGERMQRMAREMNLSESTFVLRPQQDGDARIRIFTPVNELPFAGHPLLGTAIALGAETDKDRLFLETRMGTVPFALERQDGKVVACSMQQPIPTWEHFSRPAELLAALGLKGSTFPIEVYRNGPRHVFVGLESVAALSALHPDHRALCDFPDLAVNCFAGAGRHWRSRMFSPAYGVVETPPPVPPPGRWRSTWRAIGRSPTGSRSRSSRASRSAGRRACTPAPRAPASGSRRWKCRATARPSPKAGPTCERAERRNAMMGVNANISESLTGTIEAPFPEFEAPPANPMEVLRNWLERARRYGVREPRALALATVDGQGRPSTRIVVIAELGERGVVFATHADSQKGRELAQNPWASGVLYWRESSQQIILNGRAERLPDERADAQWLSRPYQTHPMSIASRQSETLADIHALRAEARRLAETDGPLPRPPGYCLFELCLESVEFWGNGTERLHERLRYDRDEGGWKHRYLQP